MIQITDEAASLIQTIDNFCQAIPQRIAVPADALPLSNFQYTADAIQEWRNAKLAKVIKGIGDEYIMYQKKLDNEIFKARKTADHELYPLLNGIGDSKTMGQYYDMRAERFLSNVARKPGGYKIIGDEIAGAILDNEIDYASNIVRWLSAFYPDGASEDDVSFRINTRQNYYNELGVQVYFDTISECRAMKADLEQRLKNWVQL